MRRYLLTGGLFSLLAGSAFAAETVGVNVGVEVALSSLEQAAPGVQFYRADGKLQRAFGVPMEFGNSASESTALFVQNHAGAFGAEAGDLASDTVVPVRYDAETDSYRFTLTTYQQQRGGIPVFRSTLKVLTLNTADNPVVWAGSSVQNLGSFAPLEVIGGVTPEAAVPGFDVYEDVETVIFAGADGLEADPAVALSFIAERGTVADPDTYSKMLYVVNASSGAVLFEENQVLHVDVVGNVSANITQNARASACTSQVLTPMPYARVVRGSTIAYADVNGDYVMPNPGSSAVTIESAIRGLWFRVENQGGSNEIVTQSVTPPGPANFVHAPIGAAEFLRAQVDAYYHANLVRDAALSVNPSYPTIGTQQNWPVNVNINNTCNATYNGSAINFYRAGGGCNNTAFGDVVHHEYGHHLVNRAGSGQGAYGEGMSDVMGMILTGRSALGVGFQNCVNGIRNANNNIQYPCNASAQGIHYCGQLMSGSVWDTWQELKSRIGNEAAYDTILNLAVNAILLRSTGDNSITPTIFIDYLTVDDDDGNLSNGTPNAGAILAGFGSHNMVPDPPPFEALYIDFPNGVPFGLNPAGTTLLTVEIGSLIETVDPSTAEVRIRPVGGTYDGLPLTSIGGDLYQATLPGGDCGDGYEFFVRANTIEGTQVRNPPLGSFLSASVGVEATPFEDDFETDKGWTTAADASTTSGYWERGVPVNDPSWAYGPFTDSDGSGQCYLTENAPGNTDVDNGAVRLFSPVIDLADAEDVLLTYDYYLNLTVVDGNDWLRLAVSSNGLSGPWTLLANHDTNGARAWRSNQVTKAEMNAAGVTLTENMVFRFEAIDANPQSIVEAGVDAFRIRTLSCEDDPVPCIGDATGDGEIGLDDLLAVLSDFGCTSGCSGDADGDDDTDLEDLLAVLSNFGASCN